MELAATGGSRHSADNYPVSRIVLVHARFEVFTVIAIHEFGTGGTSTSIDTENVWYKKLIEVIVQKIVIAWLDIFVFLFRIGVQENWNYLFS